MYAVCECKCMCSKQKSVCSGSGCVVVCRLQAAVICVAMTSYCTYDDSTLYGTAMTVGNSIFFLPIKFQAMR